MSWLLEPSVLPWVHLATFAGVLLSLVGLWTTLWQVIRTRRTAERVEEATNDAIESLRRFDTLAAISSTLTLTDELMRLHRNGDWQRALDRYDALLGHVALIRDVSPDLTEQERRDLQTMIVHIQDFRKIVDSDSEPKADWVEFNQILSDHKMKILTLKNRFRYNLEAQE